MSVITQMLFPEKWVDPLLSCVTGDDKDWLDIAGAVAALVLGVFNVYVMLSAAFGFSNQVDPVFAEQASGVDDLAKLLGLVTGDMPSGTGKVLAADRLVSNEELEVAPDAQEIALRAELDEYIRNGCK